MLLPCYKFILNLNDLSVIIMFGFLKIKKDVDDHKRASQVNSTQSNENVQNHCQDIDQEILSINAELRCLEEKHDEGSINKTVILLNKKADLLEKLGKLDEAISIYETTMKMTNKMGVSYKRLTILYNKKRNLAIASGNDEEMRHYFDKQQALMQLSKDMLRGK